MRKHRFNSFMTAAVIASTLLTATACSKTFAPVDTLPVGTELPADTSTSTEAASTKQDSTTNKGGNTKETGLQRKVAMPQRIPVQAKIPAQRNLMPPKSPARVTYQAKPLRIAKRPQRRAATAQ